MRCAFLLLTIIPRMARRILLGDSCKNIAILDINSGPKKGLGAAYMRTMSHAIEHMGADIVMSMDADLQHDTHAITEFLKTIEQGSDVVCGTRYSDGGSIR